MHIAAYKLIAAAKVALATATDDIEPVANCLDAIRHLANAVMVIVNDEKKT